MFPPDVDSSLVSGLGQLAPRNMKCSRGSEQDFESWLRRFEDLVRMVNPPLPEQLKTNTLVGFLEGEAWDLVDEMPDQDENSCRLLDELLDRLKPTLRFYFKAANPATFDDAVVKAITYEPLSADVANSISIVPVSQPAVPAVNVLAPPREPPRNPRRNEPLRSDYRNREIRNYRNQFSRGAWERAPNSNVGRPYNQNSREMSGHDRIRPQQGTVPQQRNDRRKMSNVLAVEQAPAPDITKPGELSTLEHKDAHIAALIERNNALADLAFATRLRLKHSRGMVGFIRKFIPNFANTAEPLTWLTRKDNKSKWTEAREAAFVELRDRALFILIEDSKQLPTHIGVHDIILAVKAWKYARVQGYTSHRWDRGQRSRIGAISGYLLYYKNINREKIEVHVLLGRKTTKCGTFACQGRPANYRILYKERRGPLEAAMRQ
ncbi:hypothetical protein ANCCEY_13639 [Ancylostoma ceylanicum]|uniref:Uncharacterized protein n=1 Tax=Ancylostoma ceylanicum TaxID=53326 RepID=A0A0D6L8D4_9BILA|nr:hypothetical protein ANCCEY_13639 [Ancylostoma ceylanicum]